MVNATDLEKQTLIVGGDKFSEEEEEIIEFAQKTRLQSGLYVLLRNPFIEDVPPVLFLKAAEDLLFLALSLSWILTAIFRQDIIEDNAVKRYIGYNNLCVGWDVLPALFVGGTFWAITSFLSLRFVFFNALRLTKLRKKIKEEEAIDEEEHPEDHEDDHSFLGVDIDKKNCLNYHFPVVANFFFMITTILFSQTFMIRPEEGISIWLHTMPFLAAMYGTFIISLSLCLESSKQMKTIGWIWLVIFGITSTVNPIIFVYDFIYYDTHGERSPFPYQIVMVMDHIWFLCLALNGWNLPSTIVVNRKFESISNDRIEQYLSIRST
mmetsp:Transcript_19314/g.32075  ORF Transcript_19314/g.32075 Transcript_19314/m.32075 type:complete len:322 (+) Transcript_19314:121-1086(+)|eukprot:CAMPEP_0119023176 /NCGR_PEP_ID=MMETSP1176-20130426/29467_1 /TAXON_ID=265551 /ORGANISM="Synedropsis recta cf, Strain CCMP1620" /LENGTH=321 /DNA_ID=CAMNT_0006978193 /DNA_START=74 /DNA_END=1039 /DNA_ORIENTATION=-